MKRIIKEFVELYKSYAQFSIVYFFKIVWLRMNLMFSKSDSNYLKWREFIVKVLSTEFSDFWQNSRNLTLTSDDFISRKIWFFWYQGIEKSPPIVQLCANYLMKFRGQYDVHFLSKDNYSEYINIPSYIVDKVTAGKISVVHFSDILRFSLLAEYGGVWMDGSVLITKPFDAKYFEMSFFSIKTEKEDSGSISDYRWSTFFMYAKSHNTFIVQVRDFLWLFCKKYDYFITYLQIDYVMEILCRNNDDFAKCIQNIPYSNPNIRKLTPMLNRKCDMEAFGQLMRNTNIFKISRHYNYNENTKEGEKTLYGFLWSLQ